MLKRRHPFPSIALTILTAWLALSLPVLAEEEIQISDEAASTPTPLPRGPQAEGQALGVPGQGTKSQTGPSPTPPPTPPVQKNQAPAGPKAKLAPQPTAVPAPKEDEGYIQEDRTQRVNDLDVQLGRLDKPLFRASLDGAYARAFATNSFNSGFSGGFGGDFRAEVQFYKQISLGLYYDFALFSVPGTNVLTGPLGLFVRFIPIQQGALEFYVLGGAGINSLVSANGPTRYPGDYHGFAGLGFTQSFGDHWGLDGNAVYNYYSPDSESLNTVSARLGLTYEVDLDHVLDALSKFP